MITIRLKLKRWNTKEGHDKDLKPLHGLCHPDCQLNFLCSHYHFQKYNYNNPDLVNPIVGIPTENCPLMPDGFESDFEISGNML